MAGALGLALLGAATACGSSGGAPSDDAGAPDVGPRDATAPDAAVRDAAAPDAGDGEDAGPAPPPFRVALSVSPFSATLLRAGIRFSDGTRTAGSLAELQSLYVAHGATEVYARIGTERVVAPGTPDDHGLDSALALATMARELGLPFNPELGLWAHYGDVACQPPPDFSPYPEIVVPGPWETLGIDAMVPAVRQYGERVAREIVDTGATVEVWDVGNEVDLGTAGVAVRPLSETDCPAYRAPDGVDPDIGRQSVLGLLRMTTAARVDWLDAHVWPHEARIFGAFMEGVRVVVPDARFATHISQSTDTAFAVAFYRAMADRGVRFDELGLSYYPSASDVPAMRVAAFRDTVESLGAELERPVFVAELAYPASTLTAGPYAGWTHAVPAYPLDERGQAELLRDLAAWGASAGLSGMRPWAPEVVVEGWDFMALFHLEPGGVATMRPALDSIAAGLAAPDPAALRQ